VPVVFVCVCVYVCVLFRYPELHARVTRRLTNIPSYDINANPLYTKAFALGSRSLKLYLRGQLQVR